MRSHAAPIFALCAGLLTLASLAPARSADDANVIRLWSGKAPGEQGAVGPEKQDVIANGAIRTLTNVADPTLTLYRAPEGRANGAAVIIAPGGGYSFLSWDHEGVEVARKFNTAGVTAFVLKYRVPTRDFDPAHKLQLMDAQRSVSYVRSHAKDWGVDPARVGFLGFSAGGHLGANLATNYEARAYEAADDVDKTSCKPDFSILIYPGGLLEQDGQLASNVRPTASTPPTFVAVASDDRGSKPSSVRYWEAIRAAGVKNELHVYASGGHGFGMRASAGAASTWPDRAIEWLRGMGMVRAQQ